MKNTRTQQIKKASVDHDIFFASGVEKNYHRKQVVRTQSRVRRIWMRTTSRYCCQLKKNKIHNENRNMGLVSTAHKNIASMFYRNSECFAFS